MKMRKSPTRRSIQRIGWRTSTARALWAYRKVSGATPEAIAAILSWPLATYLSAEAGKVTPSAGQRADIQKLLQLAISKSVPADIHYRSFAHQCDDEERDDRLTTAECGLFPPGDTVSDYRNPSAVTCGKCWLTPAWLDAVRIYGKRFE